jgi:hypothetical protein
MNLRKKYGPNYPCDDDIYMSILYEAMERIITSEVEPSSIELAQYVIGWLGLDPKDLEPVEELAAIQLATAKNPHPSETIRRHVRILRRKSEPATEPMLFPRGSRRGDHHAQQSQ